MRNNRIGFAVCGSFCTHKAALAALKELCNEYETVIPIVSEICTVSDTRFGRASDLIRTMREFTGNEVISSVVAAEPIGPKQLLDALVIAPCTGNTLGKLANGITDTAVTMVAKAHLRNDRPVIIGVATNDGLSGSVQNIGKLLTRKNIYFVPFGQDDAVAKPCSLISDLTKLSDTLECAWKGKQIQPLLLR